MAKIPLWRYSAVPTTPSPVTGSPIARPPLPAAREAEALPTARLTFGLCGSTRAASAAIVSAAMAVPHWISELPTKKCNQHDENEGKLAYLDVSKQVHQAIVVVAPVAPMPELVLGSQNARRFPSPWAVEEHHACFIVRDDGGTGARICLF